MAETPAKFNPLDPAMAERRAAARKRLDAIDPAKQPGGEGDPRRRDWFEAVYALAEGDPVNVPWGNMVAHPLLADWLARNPRLDGLRALDIGCGLGDNAAALAGQGAQVTAFDLVPRAAEWAQHRFPDSGIVFCAADLFDPPAEWLGAFDFVHETYTLQALPACLLAQAERRLSDFSSRAGGCWSFRARGMKSRLATGRRGRWRAATSRRFPPAAWRSRASKIFRLA